MPGSYPSSPPLGPSNNDNNGTTESSREQGTVTQNARYLNHSQHRSLHRHRRHHSTQTIISAETQQSALNVTAEYSNRPLPPRHPHPHRDSNNVSQLRQPAPDFAARFSEFVRSPRQMANSQHPVIESYIDNEDYQSLLAAVSSIHMSRPQQPQDQAPRGREDIHTDGDDLDEQMQEVEEPDDNEEMYDSTSSSVIEDIYDLQHIMIHNQREFENQMRRAREDYARHRDNALAEIEQNQQAAANQNQSSDHSSSSYETLNSPSESMVSRGEESFQTIDSRHESAVEHYSNATDNPRPTISSSYFSPTTESTIVLSPPPPGRSSTGVLQQHGNQQTGRAGYHEPSNNMNSSAEALRFGNGPYRPFVTGRDINLQQQQQQMRDQQEQQRSQRQSQQPIRQHLQSFSSYPGRRESRSDYGDPMDQDGNRVIIGENEGGQWSIYGSLTRSSSSFEQHRYQHYQLQQQQGVPTRDHNEFSTVRPISTQLSIRSSPVLYPPHPDTIRRSPHAVAPMPFANSGPMSPSSNIPIPSRYINPAPQYASSYTATSTSSNFYRPSNITVGQNQYAYRRSNVSNDYESSSGPRRRAVNGASQSYSETVERAEAGGWAPSSYTLAGGSTSTSWYDEPLEYRGRHNIGLKEVMRMACRFCEAIICERGMKAQLLADQSVALLSTDDAPQSVQLVGVDYKPTNCLCRIKDTACLVCGNAIGYHITQPCDKCLNAENNGHLWLFHPEYIFSCPRWDPVFMRPLRWGELPHPEQDFETLSLGKVMQGGPDGSLVVGGMVRREYDAICR
ncbi:Protein fam72a [Linnemannia exigua]|uniref:Protein fam72a n=1 Tax=Linnemannia exigua TaxID=604196 RepID=A0AAD4D573_9FUNG|nr:Protein fam72a [Linnemannia exigua]